MHHISGQGMMFSSAVSKMPGSVQIFFQTGYLAVQTFFVLSGFVLAQNYATTTWDRKSLRNYFVARFARIYPVYIFSLLVVSKFIFYSLSLPTRTVGKKISLMVDYIFLLQGWKGNLGVGWNTPAWTLTCEFFFYLCFPFLLPLIRNAGVWVLALWIVLNIVIPPALPHYGVPWDWKPIYHVCDFAMGIVASRIFDLTKAKWSGRGAWLYLPALVAGIALILHPQAMDGTYADIQTGLRPLNVIALVGLAWGGGAVARWLSTNRMDLLGKASYSLYILHVPVLWWYNRWATQRQSAFQRTTASIIYIAIVVAVSVVVFKRIEVPMNKRVRKAWSY